MREKVLLSRSRLTDIFPGEMGAEQMGGDQT
jgi:hypothetical protein